MTETAQWEAPRQLAELTAKDVETPGVVFRVGQYLYRTTGKGLGHGGMGTVFLLARKNASGGSSQAVVGKVFHSDYLLQLRTDDLARRDHYAVMRNVERIAELDHPHLLPTYVSTQISDNFLTITPIRAETLRSAVTGGTLSPRRKVELLMQAVSGLSAMHSAGFLHRDFTLRNILVDEKLENASLFDFDLSLEQASVVGQDYRTRFQGRIFGSPGYSLAPEVLDTQLMASPIDRRLDLYAVGSSLFGLFTEELPYGDAEDMWSLLLRVAEGVVRGGRSFINYPDSVPKDLRPIIENCMERDPALRPKSADDVIASLREVLPKLQRDRRRTSSFNVTMRYGDKQSRLESIGEASRDRSVGPDLIATIDRILQRHGYQLRRALGRIKGHAIFMAEPDQELVALGRFPDVNAYPKIVTALDLSTVDDRIETVEAWMTRYHPALRKARQGLLTPLHKVVYDAEHGFLLLLSEYVDDARFGTDLAEQVLELGESLGLGYLVAKQVSRLHEFGLAHNNVSAEALLLKGYRATRRVHPAMVGIVAPSEAESDMCNDAREMAKLMLGWIPEEMISGADSAVHPRLEVLMNDLRAVSTSETASMAQLIELCEDGLSTIDFNFGVLRENGGDLQAYALLLTSHSLFGRLWN